MMLGQRVKVARMTLTRHIEQGRTVFKSDDFAAPEGWQIVDVQAVDNGGAVVVIMVPEPE